MDHPHPAVRDAYEKLQVRSDRLGDDVDLLTCDRCGHAMVVRSTQVTDDPCKNDIRIKCPTTDDEVLPEDSDPGDLGVQLDGCGWWTRHGIPISREEHDREMDRRDHRLVDAVNTPAPDDGRTVEERLNALGYLDT